MATVYYRRHDSPGCGGCLFFLLFLALLFGGAPAVFNIFGFLLFLLFAGILAAVGLFWGLTYFVRSRIANYEKSQTEAHNTFVNLLVHILVKVAQADGQVTREETRTIAEFFRIRLRYNQSQLLWVKELVKEAIHSSLSLDDLLAEFRQRFAHEPRLICLELVYQVIFAKVPVPAELELASRIAASLGISDYEHMTIRAKFMSRARQQQATDDRYYEVLGLAPTATMDEVKKAYRQLSMQYHPDKVAHLGEEFRQVAEEKMKEINEAYQYLKDKMT